MNSSQEYYRRLNSVKKQLAAYGAKTFGSLERMEERLARFKQQEQEQQRASARLEQARQQARELVAAAEALAALQIEEQLAAAHPTPTPASLRAEFQEPAPHEFVSLRADAEYDWGMAGPPPPCPVLTRQNAVDLDDVPNLPPPPPLERQTAECACCDFNEEDESPTYRRIRKYERDLVRDANVMWHEFLDQPYWMHGEYIHDVIAKMEALRDFYEREQW
jgi:hypothetical protein